PPPPPAPGPPPSAGPAPSPSLSPVRYPRHRAAPRGQPTRDAPSPLVFVLLITVPAVIAVVALRPR
ncbi:hypothetical protein QC282_31870, partial [Streptomyces sp. DH24]|nr:hypothetical protein [Streptomyces sp. DH24]